MAKVALVTGITGQDGSYLLALRSARRKITILSFVLMIAALYLVGEATPKHGVEILYYFLGLLSALVIPHMDSGKV